MNKKELFSNCLRKTINKTDYISKNIRQILATSDLLNWLFDSFLVDAYFVAEILELRPAKKNTFDKNMNKSNPFFIWADCFDHRKHWNYVINDSKNIRKSVLNALMNNNDAELFESSKFPNDLSSKEKRMILYYRFIHLPLTGKITEKSPQSVVYIESSWFVINDFFIFIFNNRKLILKTKPKNIFELYLNWRNSKTAKLK